MLTSVRGEVNARSICLHLTWVYFVGVKCGYMAAGWGWEWEPLILSQSLRDPALEIGDWDQEEGEKEIPLPAENRVAMFFLGEMNDSTQGCERNTKCSQFISIWNKQRKQRKILRIMFLIAPLVLFIILPQAQLLSVPYETYLCTKI